MIPVLVDAIKAKPQLLTDIKANPFDPQIYEKLAQAVRQHHEAAADLLAATAQGAGLIALTRDGVDNRLNVEVGQAKLAGKQRDVQSNAPLLCWNGWPRGVVFETLQQFHSGVIGAFNRWPIEHLTIDFSKCSAEELGGLASDLSRLQELKNVRSLALVVPPDTVLQTDAGYQGFVRICKELFRDSWHLGGLRRLCMVNPPGNCFGLDTILVELQVAKLLTEVTTLWIQLRGDRGDIEPFLNPRILPKLTDLTVVQCEVPPRAAGAPYTRIVTAADVLADCAIVGQLKRLRLVECDLQTHHLKRMGDNRGLNGLERLSVFHNKEPIDLAEVSRTIFGTLRHLTVAGSPVQNADGLRSGGMMTGLLSLELSGTGVPTRHWRGGHQTLTDYAKRGPASIVQLLKNCEAHPKKKEKYPLLSLDLSDCGDAITQVIDALTPNKSFAKLLLLGLDGVSAGASKLLIDLLANRTYDCVRAFSAWFNEDRIGFVGPMPPVTAKLEEQSNDHFSLIWARYHRKPTLGEEGFEPFYRMPQRAGGHLPPASWFGGSDLP